MAEAEKLVITAIRDMKQEGFIAASLKRSGWSVIYRATSPIALKEKLLEFPTALLLLSDDFGAIDGAHQGRVIHLRGRAHPLIATSTLDPQSDFELAEIIRSQDTDQKVKHISATTAKVFAVSALHGRTGATTIAITLAEQLAQLGQPVLLVDANRIYPRLAEHFQIHNIRGEVRETRYGFSILEATQVKDLDSLAHQADHFSQIVVDLGAIRLARSGGQRVEDLVREWCRNSGAVSIFTARHDPRSSEELRDQLQAEASSPSAIDKTTFLATSKMLSRRERGKLLKECNESYPTHVEILSRDLRSIEKMEMSHSTLNFSAPQSPIVADIARYLQGERYS